MKKPVEVLGEIIAYFLIVDFILFLIWGGTKLISMLWG